MNDTSITVIYHGMSLTVLYATLSKEQDIIECVMFRN